MPEPRRLSHRSAEYAERFDRADHRSPFAHPAFVDAVTEAFDLDVQTWATDAATLSVWSRRFGPLRRFSHPAFCYYSPITLSESVTIEELRSLAVRAGASRLQLPPGLHVSEEASTRVREFKTYLIGPPALEPTSWSTSQRRLFNRSRDAYQLRQGTVDEVVSRSVDAYGRHARKPPFKEARMRALVSRLRKTGLVEIHTLDGPSRSNEASLALLFDDRTACYWLAGSDPGAAMTVLLGSVFERLKDRGLSLDFLGANTPSIAEFKRRFGGELTTHLHLEPEPAGVIDSLRRIFPRR